MQIQFSDNSEVFKIKDSDRITGLYFPIANEAGMKSSITPFLGGDAKTGQNTFLLQPVSIENLHESRSSRNFWLCSEEFGAWSVTGVSALQEYERFIGLNTESVSVECGFLWHKV